MPIRPTSLLAGAALALGVSMACAQTPVPTPPAPIPMTLTSASFADGAVIDDRYSMNAAMPVSPAFAWADAPAATVSFAIIMHDVDSLPRPGFPDNLHWLMFNIPATAHGLPEAIPAAPRLPDGTIQGLNGSRKVGYLPLGARIVYHHYVVELYALDTTLDLSSEATRADVLAAIDGHVIAKAAYSGRFHR